MAAAELRLHGSESLSVLYIRRGPYEAAFRTRQSTRLQDVPAVEVMEGARVLFDLPSAMIRRSFAERTLILFYLPDAGNTQQSESFSVKLFTPVTIFLDASVPEVQRVLVFGDEIVYDVDAISSDSGLLFKFADTSRAAFQEVTLFLLSAIFGFTSALLLEDVIKYATNAAKRRRRAA